MDARINDIYKKYLNEKLNQIIISNTTDEAQMTKVKIRPVELKGRIAFQVTEYIGTKVFHANKSADELISELGRYYDGLFKQTEIKSETGSCNILISKKGTVTIKEKSTKQENAPARILSHNREKSYIIEEGTKVPFMVDLGVMTPAGKIVTSKYDKFRQINRYLEFVEDILPVLPKDREVSIIDFGCGKSYLTFAMYYYLHELRGYNLSVTGLDLKDDVIKNCNELAGRYGYDKLTFLHGDIADYECDGKVDMVVTLHACDTATDYALSKAVKWGASVILCVPCCQHEINRQIKNDTLKPVLKYGLIKERMSALITDALRANMLEEQGYKTQILEFIDMEHTPKNILIRGIKDDAGKKSGEQPYIETMKELQIAPTLYKLLHK